MPTLRIQQSLRASFLRSRQLIRSKASATQVRMRKGDLSVISTDSSIRAPARGCYDSEGWLRPAVIALSLMIMSGQLGAAAARMNGVAESRRGLGSNVGEYAGRLHRDHSNVK